MEADAPEDDGALTGLPGHGSFGFRVVHFSCLLPDPREGDIPWRMLPPTRDPLIPGQGLGRVGRGHLPEDGDHIHPVLARKLFQDDPGAPGRHPCEDQVPPDERRQDDPGPKGIGLKEKPPILTQDPHAPKDEPPVEPRR
jgi:hypothetical protein